MDAVLIAGGLYELRYLPGEVSSEVSIAACSKNLSATVSVSDKVKLCLFCPRSGTKVRLCKGSVYKQHYTCPFNGIVLVSQFHSCLYTCVIYGIL